MKMIWFFNVLCHDMGIPAGCVKGDGGMHICYKEVLGHQRQVGQ
jgi:hypothetical protein